MHYYSLKSRNLARKISETDIETIVSLEKKCFAGGAWTLESLKNHLMFGDGLIGDASNSYILYSENDEEVELLRIGVSPEFRNCGFGKKLLTEFLQSIKNKKAFLEVRESNSSAIRLYSSVGFKELRIRKKYYSDGENAIIMQFP